MYRTSHSLCTLQLNQYDNANVTEFNDGGGGHLVLLMANGTGDDRRNRTQPDEGRGHGIVGAHCVGRGD